jgi:hypothetical protein
MSSLTAATRFPRTRTVRLRADRKAQAGYVAMDDYIPAGTSDLWKSTKRRLTR